MELSSRYNPNEVEEKWYKHWESNNYFKSTPDDREPFTILIPPPNVTGVLHMGHMLNNTIQDVLIRKARLEGKNACWVPGTDHASIATEAKVVKKLRDEGIKKSDLSRDEFLNHAWEWTDNYGGIILQQLKKLGASPDWDRTVFTMDDVRYKSVIKVFVNLYKKGKLYRKNRMVNWDPKAKTVLSNEEVLYSEENSKLYYVRYRLENSDDYITIATTRPETILGDTAIAVHPEDERYAHLKGSRAIVPLIDKPIPIIFDNYVDKEFGTGALKITPAHDPNDYEIGEKHKLEIVNILNDDATISPAGQLYIGESRFNARKLIVSDLEEKEFLVKTEDLVHNVGRSERTNVLVEPRLSLQWYVDMKSLAAPALAAVENNEINFYPEKYKNTYRHWMTNIRDWCISRQLWWGQRIPAWYYNEDVFVAETEEEAFKLAQEKYGNGISRDDLKQDEDVLDTWFSSWLWPISVFDGFESREDLSYYYPTSVLVTGWDIIFLWVARMIMAGYEWENTFPFKDVYFTGMVRDKKRRKMSKSLGNSPDALKLIEDYGADGVRFGMLSCSPAGGDLLFDDKLVENGRNFSNKIWNAVRFIKGLKIDQSLETPAKNQLAQDWITSQLNKTILGLNDSFKTYRISEALMNLYTFIWNDFFSWFIELIKPEYGKPIDRGTYDFCIQLFETCCTLLHPFMPFITEEIWHQIKDRKEGEDCINSQYPEAGLIDDRLISDFNLLKSIVSNVRDIRNKNQMPPKEQIDVAFINNPEIDACMVRNGFREALLHKAYLKSFEGHETGEKIDGISFICGKTKFFAQIQKELDVEEEITKLEEELKYQQGFVVSVEKKLSNERFVNNAPEAVVEKERKKLSDGQARIDAITKLLEKLRKG
ncbi:MAG: valine--tRNA ligase [Bacteroidia bacterium]|nr:valine--tRNA ligase [Bacteroidia bacterium]